jgi:hypothetical protein
MGYWRQPGSMAGRVVVIGALLGLVAACDSGTTEAVRTVPVPVTVEVAPATTATPQEPLATTEPAALPETILHLRTATGVAALDPASGRILYDVASGVASADWSTIAATEPGTAGATRVTTIDGATGTGGRIQEIPGTLVPFAVSRDGAEVVLADPTVPGLVPGMPGGRTRTHVVVASLRGHEPPRTFDVAGNIVPEAFSSDAASIYVLQYLPADRPAQYSVRTLDRAATTTGPQLGGLKTNEEWMVGHGRTQALAPDNTRLFTLYTNAAGNGEPPEAFVHMLYLDVPVAECLDLPAELGLQDGAPGAIAVSPDSRFVYVVGPTGTLAELDATSDGRILRTVDVDLAGNGPSALAVTHDRVYVSTGDTLVALDREQLQPERSYPVGQPVTGALPSRDSRHVFVVAGDAVRIVDTTSGVSIATYPVPGARIPVPAIPEAR